MFWVLWASSTFASRTLRRCAMKRMVLSECAMTKVLVCLMFPILCNLSSSGQELPYGRVEGFVAVQVQQGALLPGAKVIFEAQDGSRLETTSDSNGHFSIALPAGNTYSVTVQSRGFFPEHRPPFRISAGHTIRFDFRLVLGHSDDAFGEDRLQHGSNEFIVLAGSKKYDDPVDLSLVRYEAYPIKDNPLPVTISFGIYTVRADHVIANHATGFFKAWGNVLIQDGTGSQPRSSACVTISSSANLPVIGECVASDEPKAK
jgi:hypothetical protein